MTITTISVLICTYNRARLLRETLTAMQAQQPPGCAVEIIVVDNNSTDNTPAVVAESAADGGFPVVSLTETRQGKSFALNTGLAHASGEVLALTDDDVLPAADWLARIVDNFRARDVQFVFGKVLPRWSRTPPPELLTTPAQDIWGPLAIVDYGDTPADYVPESHSQRLPVGANLAFSRSALLTIGGWRTDLGKVNNTLVSGEDHEIFMRMRRFGLYAGYYDPMLTVRHFVPGDRLTRRYFRRWFFWHGKTQALMLDDLYPEIDMASVPRVAGVPRFAYRQSLQQLRRWLRTLGSSDAVSALTEELHLIRYTGFFAQCWSRWLRPRPAAETIADVKPSAVRTIARVVILAGLLGMMTVAAMGGPRVQLTIRDGRVWLNTDGATAGEILAEWARVGQTSIANGERVQSGPLTLQLDGALEADALDIVLRSAGGFVAVDRAPGAQLAAPSLSRYARVVVVPGSAASPEEREPFRRAEPMRTFPPAPAPAFSAVPASAGDAPPTAAAQPAFGSPPVVAPPAFGAPAVPNTIPIAPGVQRLIGPDGLPVPDDQDGAPPPPPRPRGRGGLR